MSKRYSRREMMRLTGQALAAAAIPGPISEFRESNPGLGGKGGAIIDEKHGAEVGRQVLEDGGNAIDAMVAACLVTCIATPSRCGIGGYGGHMTIGLAGGKTITSIDYNSAAPAAARPDMYPLDDKGEVVGKVNLHGWLAAGVPGTLAGLQFALDRFGTRSLSELAQPAIRLCREGVTIDAFFAHTLRSTATNFRKDPGSAKLWLDNGEPRKQGELQRNPNLGELLATLAKRNSVDSFYRGDIAQRLAEQFQKNGGVVTAKDLAAYHAREVHPLSMQWKDYTVYTAPLTAGGLTVLEALEILKAIGWRRRGSGESLHARLEAMRYAWKDRFDLLGDPDMVKVPVERLLSDTYAQEVGAKVKAALRAKHAASIDIKVRPDSGTNNISCVDRHGNMVAATFTHGSTFGAQVTADGLGVTLGHGMSRFEPVPGHPNAPGPGKRPLHNMCPTVITRGGKPVFAVGGAGGLRIPNAIYDVVLNYITGDAMKDSLAAPRLHCTGNLEVGFHGAFPADQTDYLKNAGFHLRPYLSAYTTAVSFDAKTGECAAAGR
jgi:gamma-glutamyltranspeptidase/glutathione hydrolase